MRIVPILAFCIGHFVISFLIAVIAFGADMDQLRSRSPASRIAAEVHDLLWYPHDATLRTIPNAWLIRNRYVIPLALALNSVVWGSAWYCLWRVVRRWRRVARSSEQFRP